VIILTGTSLLELAFDATEPCSVAHGWRWGCGWRDQMSMTDSEVRWQIASRASRSRFMFSGSGLLI
jgi:hypothetical protein